MIYVIIFFAFFADRVSKWWAAAYLAENGSHQFNSLFTLVEAYNRGMAFGLFQGIGPIIGWLTIGVIIVLFIYLHRLPREQWLTRVGFAFLIGGALGNLVDRIFVGEVLDFIATPLRPGVFNVADVMIHFGMILIIIGALVHRSSDSAQQEPESA